MKYSDMEAVVEELIAFPVAHDAAIEKVGKLEILSPSGESITVEEILEPVRVEVYSTARDLYSAILGNLDDSFIGRKYYDDRGANPTTNGDGDFSVSF